MNSGGAQVAAFILAGGLARRMQGRDKGLVKLAGKPMVKWVLDKVAPQVDAVAINANRNSEDYARFDVPVVADAIAGHLGPLAGLLTGMQHFAASPAIDTIFMCPCDSPFVPDLMVARLTAAMQSQDADIAVAYDGERMQPVFCLVQCTMQDSLAQFLDSGERKIDRWYASVNTVPVDFSDYPNAFRNINTEEERLAVEQSLLMP